MRTLILTFIFFNLIPFAKAQIHFSDQATNLGIQQETMVPFLVGGGVAFFDYNNDGYEDIYLIGGMGNADKLYRNEGNGRFTDVSTIANITTATQQAITIGVTTGDLDNDGYREILVTTEKSNGLILFKNNGNGTFSNIANITGLAIYNHASYTATMGDYNEDGFLDIYIANYIDQIGFSYDNAGHINGYDHDCFPNYLFLNNGNMTFTEVATVKNVADTGCSLSASFTDFDSDGDVDILSVNDFGEYISPNALFQNDSGSFTDVSVSARVNSPAIYGMGIAIGDYDQDMDLDYYTTNIGRNTLYNNQGDGTFTDLSTSAGVENTYSIPPDLFFTTSWGCGFLDVDNDADLDLYIANGYIPVARFIQTEEHDPNILYLNNGDGTFTNIADSAAVDSSLQNRGFAFADYDQDGDLDMLVGQVVHSPQTPPKNVCLFRNESVNTNNWLAVKLQGIITNRDAFGSQLDIYVGGKNWVHEISGGASHASQHSSIAHFGLGQDTIVDSLKIRWLSGNEQVLYDIPANQLISIVEDTTTLDTVSAVIGYTTQEQYWIKAYPNPTKGALSIDYLINKNQNNIILIYNNLGQLLFKKQISKSTGAIQHLQLDLAHFPAGQYHIQIQADQQLFSKTILLEH